jgi:hypothetical protein
MPICMAPGCDHDKTHPVLTADPVTRWLCAEHLEEYRSVPFDRLQVS